MGYNITPDRVLNLRAEGGGAGTFGVCTIIVPYKAATVKGDALVKKMATEWGPL